EWEGARREIPGRYVLRGSGRVGFVVGAYDAGRPLVIDPVLVYSTYLGGGAFDAALGVAVDSAGSAYVTGRTASANFPTTPGAFDTTYNGAGSNAIGDASFDAGHGVAVDAAGSPYATGQTASANLPTTPGAFDTVFNGMNDAFVAKLNPAGTGLVYSTYLGGFFFDVGYGIAVEAA